MFSLLSFGEEYWGSATLGYRHVWGATPRGGLLFGAVKSPIQKLWFLPHERSETHPVQLERRNALCIETQAAYMMEVLRKGRKPCFRGQWFNNRNSVVGSA
jgi:hypothetical protein